MSRRLQAMAKTFHVKQDTKFYYGNYQEAMIYHGINAKESEMHKYLSIHALIP